METRQITKKRVSVILITLFVIALTVTLFAGTQAWNRSTIANAGSQPGWVLVYDECMAQAHQAEISNTTNAYVVIDIYWQHRQPQHLATFSMIVQPGQHFVESFDVNEFNVGYAIVEIGHFGNTMIVNYLGSDAWAPLALAVRIYQQQTWTLVYEGYKAPMHYANILNRDAFIIIDVYWNHREIHHLARFSMSIQPGQHLVESTYLNGFITGSAYIEVEHFGSTMLLNYLRSDSWVPLSLTVQIFQFV